MGFNFVSKFQSAISWGPWPTGIKDERNCLPTFTTVNSVIVTPCSRRLLASREVQV